MPQGPLTILIVNEHAEEVKLVAISVRGFFPDVRIDIAYSVQETAVMASAGASSRRRLFSLQAFPCLSDRTPLLHQGRHRQA